MTAPGSVPPTVLLLASPLMSTPLSVLPRAAVPFPVVPKTFPSTLLSVAPVPNIKTPSPSLPEMTLRTSGWVPPTVLDVPSMYTPARLPLSVIPSLFTPMKLPSIWLPVPPEPVIRMPDPSKFLITSPLMVQSGAAISSPSAPAPALSPPSATLSTALSPFFQGVLAGPCLGVAVYGEGVGDGGKFGRGRDGLSPGAAQIEVDDVGSCGVVGLLYGRPQGALPASGGGIGVAPVVGDIRVCVISGLVHDEGGCGLRGDKRERQEHHHRPVHHQRGDQLPLYRSTSCGRRPGLILDHHCSPLIRPIYGRGVSADKRCWPKVRCLPEPHMAPLHGRNVACCPYPALTCSVGKRKSC